MDAYQENYNDVETLNKLRAAAVEQALSTKQITDLDKAVSIIKAITDREKTAHDNRNQVKLLRNEWYKTIATAVVPLLTLLTLLVTVWVQASQLKLSQQANEDAAWRETAKNALSQLSRSDPDGFLAVELLQPYLGDAHHGREAFDLSLFMLTRGADERYLRVFFALPEVKITEDNLSLLLAHTRRMWVYLDEVRDREKSNDSPNVRNMENKLETVDDKIGEVLRTRKTADLNLSDTFFWYCNLQSVNLRGAVLTRAYFQGADLSSAVLTNVRDVSDSQWVDTNWWNAQAIDGILLKHLIKNYYPYSSGNDLHELPKQIQPPSEANYRQRVIGLCKAAGIVCSESDLKYAKKPEPQKDTGAKVVTGSSGTLQSKTQQHKKHTDANHHSSHRGGR